MGTFLMVETKIVNAISFCLLNNEDHNQVGDTTVIV